MIVSTRGTWRLWDNDDSVARSMNCLIRTSRFSPSSFILGAIVFITSCMFESCPAGLYSDCRLSRLQEKDMDFAKSAP